MKGSSPPKKTFPTLCRYLQEACIYKSMRDEFYHFLLIFRDVISFEAHGSKNDFFARFFNFVSNFNGVPSKVQHRNLHKIFSNT